MSALMYLECFLHLCNRQSHSSSSYWCRRYVRSMDAHKVFCLWIGSILLFSSKTYVILSGFFAFAYKKSLYQAARILGKLWTCLIFSILGMVISSIYNHQILSFSTIFARLFPVCSGGPHSFSIVRQTLDLCFGR